MTNLVTAQLSPDVAEMYEHDVLRLPPGQSEDHLESTLRSQAEELGLILETIPAEPIPSGLRSEKSSRYSNSVDSRVSISTGLTSSLSDGASLHSNSAIEHVRSTWSSMDLSSSRPQSMSSSSSTFSISASSMSQIKSPFRRIRGLSMLRLHKSSIKGCPHCPKDSVNQKRALHELPCGHRFCTQALRNVVVESMRYKPEPRCCGTIIPLQFIRHVLDDDEYKAINSVTLSTDGTPVRSLSLASRVDSLAPSKEMERAIRSPEHKALRLRQEAENDRFEAWIAKIKDDIRRQRVEMLKVLQDHHTKALDDQAEAQSSDMLIAEDRQVKAEADLRSLHDQELRDNATALKHMEAYCAGTLASGESHNRIITDQDMNELRKTRNMRDAMELKHSNAINILRGEQTRRIKLRAQRHASEVHQLRAQHRKEILALEQRYRLEEASLLSDRTKRRQRLHTRWKLETMICLKQLEIVPAHSLG